MHRDERFSRTQLLVGDQALDKLANASVIVFGIGGVGGYVVEALARCGIGALDLVDDDEVSLTNINRQIIATTSTIGRPKVEAMAERVTDINPTCTVTTHQCFYLPQTADRFDLAQYDYVVDAVDTVTAKLRIIQAAKEADVPVISSMGAANKLDPTAFRVADVDKTSICPLARIIRKEARQRGLGHFKVVFSTEPALKPDLPDGWQAEQRPGSSSRSLPGSIAFVPSAAGLVLAAEVVKDLIG